MSGINDISDTWNNASEVFYAIRVDVTRSNSAAGSAIVWAGLSGVPMIRVEADAVYVRAYACPEVNDAVTPTVSFGNGDTGFYENVPNNMRFAHAGVAIWKMGTSNFGSITTFGARFSNITGGATSPSFNFEQDTDTGIGRKAIDTGVLIAGATNCLEFGESGSAPTLGFFGTAAIAKQTSVVQNIAGVHAALVNLGLIEA